MNPTFSTPIQVYNVSQMKTYMVLRIIGFKSFNHDKGEKFVINGGLNRGLSSDITII